MGREKSHHRHHIVQVVVGHSRLHLGLVDVEGCGPGQRNLVGGKGCCAVVRVGTNRDDTCRTSRSDEPRFAATHSTLRATLRLAL